MKTNKIKIDGNKCCNHCGISSKPLKLCSVCQRVYYCSRKCCKIGWKNGHRNVCIANHKPEQAMFNRGDIGVKVIVVLWHSYLIRVMTSTINVSLCLRLSKTGTINQNFVKHGVALAFVSILCCHK